MALPVLASPSTALSLAYVSFSVQVCNHSLDILYALLMILPWLIIITKTPHQE